MGKSISKYCYIYLHLKTKHEYDFYRAIIRRYNMENDRKLFAVLLVACIFGTIAVLPYTLTLQGELIQNLPVPLYVLLTAQLIQSIILFGVAIFIGLHLARKVGLGLPILNGWLEGRDVKKYLRSILGVSVGLGILASILIIGLDYLFSLSGVTINVTQDSINPPAWQGFFASFYGGINEEILLRLFVMTFIAWILFKVKRTDQGKPTSSGMWLAIVLAAVIFGAGHLPAVMTITTLTPLVIVRTIVLNAAGGIIFGWLYWKKGLESAMISHFSADIVLHVILPLIALI
ncbi:CPBP family intramembrane glutamic endopeptidase [Methanolobus sp.]|uniref:CPBP family intramembrane glutamic endopeptidase n=1 Tax=Methanolobus sp. TaxID=1874737 RepID=UPI0025D71D0D|nr:CPBP family intramembrane glutamic endopeptidase [Methanolobus sp.]